MRAATPTGPSGARMGINVSHNFGLRNCSLLVFFFLLFFFFRLFFFFFF